MILASTPERAAEKDFEIIIVTNYESRIMNYGSEMSMLCIGFMRPSLVEYKFSFLIRNSYFVIRLLTLRVRSRRRVGFQALFVYRFPALFTKAISAALYLFKRVVYVFQFPFHLLAQR